MYNFADLKLLHQTETVANPRGLVAISSTAAMSATGDNTVLACPGLHTGQVGAKGWGAARGLHTGQVGSGTGLLHRHASWGVTCWPAQACTRGKQGLAGYTWRADRLNPRSCMCEVACPEGRTGGAHVR